MLWGITQETIETWLGRRGRRRVDRPRLRGVPGVVEGVARVLLNVNDIGQIREGEMLVCPVTAPSWGPVFGKIAAAVSDIGGTMSHAAIVAREYGMPAVVGTGMATTRIKTGDRVRVDGDRGVVTVLISMGTPMTSHRSVLHFRDVGLGDVPRSAARAPASASCCARASRCRPASR